MHITTILLRERRQQNNIKVKDTKKTILYIEKKKHEKEHQLKLLIEKKIISAFSCQLYNQYET